MSLTRAAATQVNKTAADSMKPHTENGTVKGASQTEGKCVQNCGQTSSVVCTEIWATTRGQEVNEIRMLRWMCRVTRMDKIRNEHIRGTTKQEWCKHPRKLQKNESNGMTM